MSMVRSAVKMVGGAPVGLGRAAIGAGMGGMFGYMGSGSDNKMLGTLGGAAAGITGGAVAAGFSARGGNLTRSAFKNMMRMRGSAMKAGRPEIASGLHSVAKGMRAAGMKFHSKSSRRSVFASGAMLGGGGFGVMFAGNGRSHKRGFNGTRGNSITR